MSEQEELRIRRAINAASQSGDAAAELAARRELQALLGGQQAGQADTQQQPEQAPERDQFAEAQRLAAQTQPNPFANPEALLSMATSAALEPVAGVAGIVGSLIPGEEGQGARAVEAVRGMAYEPRTEYGRAGLERIGQMVAPVGQAFEATGEFLGMGAEETGRIFGVEPGSPQAAALFALGKSMPEAFAELVGLRMSRTVPAMGRDIGAPGPRLPQTPRRQQAAQLLSEGRREAPTAPFELVDSYSGAPRVERVPQYAQAVRQGFPENFVASLGGAEPGQVRAIRQMVDIRERQLADFDETRFATDVVGDEMGRRIEFVSQLKENAGKAVDRAANALKGRSIDATGIADQMRRAITEKLGVDFDDAGNMVFGDNSTIKRGSADATLLNDVLRRASVVESRGSAYTAHMMKRYIDNNVSYGKNAEGGVTGQVESIVKGVRQTVDDLLDGANPDYDQANTTYSGAIQTLGDMQDAVGPSIDLRSTSGVGAKMRSLFSNNATRPKLEDAARNLEDFARANGAEFDTNVTNLAKTAYVLDDVLGPERRTGFEGSARAAQIPMDRAGFINKGLETLRDLTLGPIDKQAAIKSLQDATAESLRRRSARQ